jgi:5-oxoprolinase (ATP-hydrolysing)
MRTALIHPHAGLLSAYGIGLAPLRDTREAALDAPLDAAGLDAAKTALARLADIARRAR